MTSSTSASFPTSAAARQTLAQADRVAFISVYDKTGLDQLAPDLVHRWGYQLVSTGGTCQYLRDIGLPVIESSDITGFQALLGGRVKSLHPDLFAAILAEGGDDRPARQATGVPFLIDLVIVNLYPFEQVLEAQPATSLADMMHWVDIGGASLIRAGSKNHEAVAIVSDPGQYGALRQELRLGQGQTSLPFRQKLAQAGFQHSLAYETAISRFFAQQLHTMPGVAAKGTSPEAQADAEALLPNSLTWTLCKAQTLRYGENPHQSAALYTRQGTTPDFDLLHGKPLSYNNLLDMQSAWDIVNEFAEPAYEASAVCVIIKHNNPCGVALSPRNSVQEAYQLAFDADPLSAFGGIVAFNRPVTADVAEKMKDVFLEVIVAPGFMPDALALLQAKKNLRLVVRPLATAQQALQPTQRLRQLNDDMFLVQVTPSEASIAEAEAASTPGQVVTEAKPTQDHWRDMQFGWRVAKHVKSNAMVLVKEGRTVGIGVGQTSRIGALEIALKHASDEAKDAVLASDGFLPQEDNIYAAVQNRVGAIIQPGGSIKDADVVALANQHHLPMVVTGRREFKH
jgi:phosphoribosylaminoimidazolecarboxamide formyltransferase/IMP cyclohydrolase